MAKKEVDAYMKLAAELDEVRDRMDKTWYALPKEDRAKIERTFIQKGEQMSAIKKNTYRVRWEHEDGHTATSAEIDVSIFGDVVVEHIHVLAEFRSIFCGPLPSPVKKILAVELVREHW